MTCRHCFEPLGAGPLRLFKGARGRVRICERCHQHLRVHEQLPPVHLREPYSPGRRRGIFTLSDLDRLQPELERFQWVGWCRRVLKSG